MTTVHVIPVPRGMEPEDSWNEIQTTGQLVEYAWWKPRFHWPLVKWATVVDGDDGPTFWQDQ